MASEYKYGGHSIHDIQYHVCWCTKYRYAILRGEIGERCRDLLRQIAMAREITIIRGAIAPDHVHMLISAPPSLAPAKIVQYLKGRSSRKLQMEYETLSKRYWGQHEKMWDRHLFLRKCRKCGTGTYFLASKSHMSGRPSTGSGTKFF